MIFFKKLSIKKIGFLLGFILFIFMLFLPAPEGMAIAAWRVVATTILMATWWITEAVPAPATSLIPIILFPLFHIMDSQSITLSYGNHTVFLFMGGFFLAVAMEKWSLHRRIALLILKRSGDTPSRLILGFMVATALLSMWISNTATAAMMIPIGLTVISQVMGSENDKLKNDEKTKKEKMNFAKSLMLAIAYTATAGGFITLIGTPPNLLMVGILESNFGIKISFGLWMMISIPISLPLLVSVYFLLTKVLFPTHDLKLTNGKKLIIEEMEKLGVMTKAEKLILSIGGFMAFCWIFRNLLIRIPFFSMLTDTTVAIIGALLLFLCPSFDKDERLLDWDSAIKIPWGVVLLFGGGFALASGFENTGLMVWVSERFMNLGGIHILFFVFIVVLATNIMTEFVSNTTLATLFIPIMGITALQLGFHPITAIIATTIATSFSFMMPMATPPNAIAFGSGFLDIKDIVSAGALLNIIGQVICVLAIVYLLPVVWRVDLTVVPAVLNYSTTPPR